MFIASKLFAKHHITAIFSDRQGGISHAPFDSLNLGLGLGDSEENVQHNLKQLCTAAELPVPHRSQQVHGTDYLLCDGEGVQHTHQADILITCTAGCSVAVRTADCLPILLIDPNSGVVAAVHAGWRGTAKNIADIAIQQMKKFGANPEHILACLGPSIATCCFEVDMDTGKQLSQSHPDAHLHIHHKNHKAWPNIQAINALQLQSSGIQPDNMAFMTLCTSCLPARFYSYRRDGIQSGRQLAIVALPMSL
ncbi:MAG: peptidoglycan editing factor PgeF [Mariprofundaceae bacterium]|nr:peptidoglycan editing factor PgeF [Mariprofundaceae bacterium]